MTLSSRLVAAIASLAIPSSLLAWGDDGHNAIWEVAQSRLNAIAKHEVASLLKGERADLTAVWMDRARDAAKGKGGDLADDLDAMAFNTQFKFNASWHYTDLPLESPSFEAAAEFHPGENIVSQLVLAIQALEGKSKVMDKKTALRVVVHLVGDIHQPLHCSSGFFDVSDPARPILHKDMVSCLKLEKDHSGDQGGNLLFFGTGTYDQLHGYWDIDAVKRVMMLSKLSDVLQKHTPEVKAETTGAIHEWPSKWATESVRIAAKVYEGLQFGACTLNTDKSRRGKFSRIDVKLPADYDARSKQIALDQMTKAAVRLADLLNTIWN